MKISGREWNDAYMLSRPLLNMNMPELALTTFLCYQVKRYLPSMRVIASRKVKSAAE